MVWWSHPSPKRTIYSSLHWSVTKSDERVPNMDWHTYTGFFSLFFRLKVLSIISFGVSRFNMQEMYFSKRNFLKNETFIVSLESGSNGDVISKPSWVAHSLKSRKPSLRLTHFSRPGIISNHVKFVLRSIVDGLLVKISDCRAFSPFKTVPGCLVRSVEFPSVDNQAIL